MRITAFASLLLIATFTNPENTDAQVTGTPESRTAVAGYPDGVQEVRYRSDGDDTMQPTLIWYPKADRPKPLLVALHTWSSDYRQTGGEVQYAKWCQQAGWAFIHPNFRGVNNTPQALGSDLVIADIRSAVEFAKSQTKIDVARIYCVGVSGGGHASLLMAAREPDLWAGVSAWCGISDIGKWHDQCHGKSTDRYARMIESAIGGSPKTSDQFSRDAWHRSPLKWLAEAERLPPLDINHGIHDGRAGSVPFTHSMLAYSAAITTSAAITRSAVSADSGPISESLVREFYQTRQVPDALKRPNIDLSDSLYGNHQPRFRIQTDRVRLTIFDGGHEIVHEAALNWLAAQAKNQPVNWNPKRRIPFSADESDQQSGK